MTTTIATNAMPNQAPVQPAAVNQSQTQNSKKEAAESFQDMVNKAAEESGITAGQTEQTDKAGQTEAGEKTEQTGNHEKDSVSTEKKDGKDTAVKTAELKPGEIIMLADVMSAAELEIPMPGVRELTEGRMTVEVQTAGGVQAETLSLTAEAGSEISAGLLQSLEENVALQELLPAAGGETESGRTEIKPGVQFQSLAESTVKETPEQVSKTGPETGRVMTQALDANAEPEQAAVLRNGNQTEHSEAVLQQSRSAAEQMLKAETLNVNSAQNAKLDGNLTGTASVSEQSGAFGAEKKEVKAENANLEQMVQSQTAHDGQPEDIVRIKVAEPYHQLNQETVKKLGGQIGQKLLEGKQELLIQLEPEHLGRISIKLSMLEAGAKVIVSCENQKTLGLLTERAEAIGQIVERNTGNPAVVEVKEDNYWNQQKNATDDHGRQNQDQNQSREEQQNRKNSKEETEDFMHQLRLGFFDGRLAVQR